MNKPHTAATPLDLVVVTAICFGLFILSSIDGVIRGFPPYRVSDYQLASLIFLELAMTMIAVSYLRIRHHDLRALFPAPTAKGLLVGGGLHLVTLVAALNIVRDTMGNAWLAEAISGVARELKEGRGLGRPRRIAAGAAHRRCHEGSPRVAGRRRWGTLASWISPRHEAYRSP